MLDHKKICGLGSNRNVKNKPTPLFIMCRLTVLSADLLGISVLD